MPRLQPLARRVLRCQSREARRRRRDADPRRRRGRPRDRVGARSRPACDVAPADLRALPVLQRPALRADLGGLRAARPPARHARCQHPLLRPRRRLAADLARRGRLLRPPRALVPDLLRRVRTPPEPAHGLHRAACRLGRSDARVPRRHLPVAHRRHRDDATPITERVLRDRIATSAPASSPPPRPRPGTRSGSPG